MSDGKRRRSPDLMLVFSPNPHLLPSIYMPEDRELAFTHAKAVGGLVCPLQVIVDYRQPRTESNAGGHAQ